jgi:hypothetical protein
MKIMHLDDAPLVRGLEHRGGTFHSRTMAEVQILVELART